ncbi:MAG: carbohydrate kinase family protein [Ignavibacteriaceae bacterium]|nr:carbohydrate kinase family protein [Ignavibacteriaceae bacterium]
MYDLICVGNIAIDLYYKGESLTNKDGRFQLAIGGKYHSDYFYEGIGGGGYNVAVGVAKHGLKTAIFSRIGNNNFKETILNKLKQKNVSSEFCQFEENYNIISSILLTETGERTIISYDTPGHMVKKFFLHDDLKKAKNVYVSSLTNVSLEDKIKIITYLKGDQTLTFVNLSIVDCKREPEVLYKIFDSLDVLIINAHEYCEMIKKPYEEIDFKNLELTLPYLKNRILIITDAEKGSFGYFKNEKYFQEAVKPKKIVDTTGGGDAYTAGFIAQYLKSKDIKSSMKLGAKYAAEKLSRIGAN